jgi:hypothetical protein
MHQHAQPGQPTPAESFPTDPSGLPEATRPQLRELADGEVFDLRIGPVAKRLGGTTVRMLGYNGSIPGPTLKVRQGSEVVVQVTNEGDLEATVHWHGLRLENKYDGVPHETQTPIPVGGEFTYRIRFPDPGLYWYHPHIREDYTQEMGLYGNILVDPADPGYWPPADRDVLLTLDDLLLEDGKIAPFSPAETTYTAMGRFGNVPLVSGDEDYSLTARAGEVVRLWLTNTANTRVFNVRLPGRCPQCGMKLLVTALAGQPAGHGPAAAPHSPSAEAPPGRRAQPRGDRGHRVGRRHGGGQPADHPRQHAVEAGRPGQRCRQRCDRLAVHRRGAGEDPAGQRDGFRPSHAPPVPPARGRPVPGAGP